ncbi:MAG: hypothetical protein GF375_04635 [Candidatus Omnitrophica bacterium]|nr:hypothetical protein [Candidatus Omnitrophota bacterium]MBD3269314.1 hypothetical protein [Candidatus Omnitrophota bacterium]
MNKAFDIIFNDESLIAVNKKVKILTCSNRKGGLDILTLLQKEMKTRVFPCHRLDRETTGILIFARGKKTRAELMEQFRDRKIEKGYLAFVRGKIKPDEGKLESFILDKEGRRFGERRKKALTYYKLIKDKGFFSYLSLKPVTGRRNQLRIQLAQIGHPILGERKYALGRDFRVKFRRLALHASAISFIHPLSRERIGLRVGLPPDMENFLKR